MKDADASKLANDLGTSLRSLVEIPRLNPNGFFAQHGLFARCETVLPGCRPHEPNARIFVDGFCGAVNWNSWQVYTNALEEGISLWMGLACFGTRWMEHSWCMLDDRIVESTFCYHTYFGAKLNATESKYFGERFGNFDLLERDRLEVCTMKNRLRRVVPYDRSVHKGSIGRERDFTTHAVLPGLGRSTNAG